MGSLGAAQFISGQREIWHATTRITSNFVTSSDVYVDVTNATITITGLTASKTYRVIAWYMTDVISSAATQDAIIGIAIAGTIGGEQRISCNLSAYKCVSLVNSDSVTGVTSVICKVQVKDASASASNLTFNDQLLKNVLFGIAIEV